MTRGRALRGFLGAAAVILGTVGVPATAARATASQHPTSLAQSSAPQRPAAARPRPSAGSPSAHHRRQQLGAVAGAIFVVVALTLWSFDFGLLGGKIAPLSRPLVDRRSRSAG